MNFNLNDALAILERTPATLNVLLAGLPDAWITATEGEGTWSPYDVVGHLIQGERADWIPRARHILSGENRPFEPFDREAQFKESKDKTLTELLTDFSEQRQASLLALRRMNLADEDLDRRGLHPDFGDVTLRQLMATWVVHDLDHIVQISRTMAKAYSEATGPWIAYLSVLRDRVTS